MPGQIKYAFMCIKSSPGLRPNFHQKEERVDTHMFISVVAYHLMHWGIPLDIYTVVTNTES